MNHPPRSLPFAVLAALFLLHPFSFVVGPGPLTPPGAPAPVMKTLAQIEPRTDLQATPAPTGVDTTNASYHFVINQPGSYYLSANLGVTKPHGIRIAAEGVTLDLNGFEISRAAGTRREWDRNRRDQPSRGGAPRLAQRVPIWDSVCEWGA